MKISLSLLILTLPSFISAFVMQEFDENTQWKWKLIRAAADGHLNLVKEALDHNVDVNTEIGGITALHKAASGKNIAVVELLLKSNADVHAKNNQGGTPLHFASVINRRSKADQFSNDLDDLERLLNEDLPSKIDINIKIDRLAIANLLLKYGANVNAQDHNQNTPLHLASACGFKDMLELLLNSDANINAMAINQGNMITPLNVAIINHRKKATDLLLLAGASIDNTSEYIKQILGNGFELTFAVLQDNLGNVVKIIASNQSPKIINQCDVTGKTALMWAAARGKLFPVNGKDEPAIVDALLKNKSHEDLLVTEALLLAKKFGRQESVEKIYDYLSVAREQLANEIQDIGFSMPVRLLVSKYIYGDKD